jgi:pSer/pThr/pTyr-binding forkhead associated (FHA) protein
MGQPVPVLFGIAGLVAGETWLLSQACDISIGRSRSCAVSLRLVAKYKSAPPESRDEDHDFNTVSRRHVKLVVGDGIATVEDLSSNGTLLNGQAITSPVTVDLRRGAAEIRLGTRETVRLELIDSEDPRLASLDAVTGDTPSGAVDAQGSALESNTLRPA